MADQRILKESGETEAFNRRKIRRSLINSGVRPRDADDLIERVVLTLEPPLTTRKIFRSARRLLRGYDLSCTMRYSLKEAIYALGPTGYPFEKYIGRVLGEQGYQVQVGALVKGHCVTHEVDVVARKEGVCHLVECKFHQNRKTTSDVKTALYVYARFLDIEKARALGSAEGAVNRGMLVTNTRLTSEAIKYADCVGLKTMGWKHPDGGGLQQVIEAGRTYPVTVLPSANRSVVRALVGQDIVLARDVRDRTAQELARRTGLKLELVQKLKEHADRICA